MTVGMTRPERRELLAMALCGTWSDGTAAPALHPLLLGTWPGKSDPARAFASELLGAVPPASYSVTSIPRSASAWTVAVNLDGSVTATASTFRVGINVAVPSLAGIVLAQAPGLGASNRLLAEHEVYGGPAVSGRQFADLAGVGITLHPILPSTGAESFYTSAGLAELLHLATGDRTSTGSGVSAFNAFLIRDSFSWGSATPSLTMGDLAPHLIGPEDMDPPPTFARSPSAWTFTLSVSENLAHARPSAPSTFVYRGGAAATVNGLAFCIGGTLGGGTVLVAAIRTDTKTMEPGNTCEMVFSVPSP